VQAEVTTQTRLRPQKGREMKPPIQVLVQGDPDGNPALVLLDVTLDGGGLTVQGQVDLSRKDAIRLSEEIRAAADSIYDAAEAAERR
jgi:hypothetical protein